MGSKSRTVGILYIKDGTMILWDIIGKYDLSNKLIRLSRTPNGNPPPLSYDGSQWKVEEAAVSQDEADAQIAQFNASNTQPGEDSGITE